MHTQAKLQGLWGPSLMSISEKAKASSGVEWGVASVHPSLGGHLLPSVVVRAVSVVYGRGRRAVVAVDGLDLEVQHGEDTSRQAG